METDETSTPRKEGRAAHLTPERKHAIRLAYLEGGGTLTRVALAAQFDVNRDTVASCLSGDEFDAMRDAFLGDVTANAKRRLQQSAVKFADNWIRAADTAADDGNHKPSRDALEALGVVGQRGHTFVALNVSMPGMADYVVPVLPGPIAADVFPQGRPAPLEGETTR